MSAVLLFSLVLVPAQDTGPCADYPREPHPLARSLPQLGKDEEARIGRVIERFIQYDTGRLPKKEGPKALADLRALGPEAFFLLVDAFNRTANLQDSCPAVIIGRKLVNIINATEDPDVLAFAKETIGAEVKIARHMGVVKDLQLAVILRRGALQRQQAAVEPYLRQLRSLDTDALADLTSRARGPQLKHALAELEKRKGPEVLNALASAAANKDEKLRLLGHSLLARHLKRQTADALKEALKDKRAPVRMAAVQAAGPKAKELGGELIALLDDRDPCVRELAQKALVRLAGRDFGPGPDASQSQRILAIEQWRQWWKERHGASR